MAISGYVIKYNNRLSEALWSECVIATEIANEGSILLFNQVLLSSVEIYSF